MSDSVFNVSYLAGGEVGLVKKIGEIKGFPSFTQPFNIMIERLIPPITDTYILEYETPDEPLEIMAVVVSCSGYSQTDKYDVLVNGEVWYKDWCVSEMNEALFLGTSTYVYALPPKSKFEIKFKNFSGQGKQVRVGFRMLRGSKQNA